MASGSTPGPASTDKQVSADRGGVALQLSPVERRAAKSRFVLVLFSTLSHAVAAQEAVLLTYFVVQSFNFTPRGAVTAGTAVEVQDAEHALRLAKSSPGALPVLWRSAGPGILQSASSMTPLFFMPPGLFRCMTRKCR